MHANLLKCSFINGFGEIDVIEQLKLFREENKHLHSKDIFVSRRKYMTSLEAWQIV